MFIMLRGNVHQLTPSQLSPVDGNDDVYVKNQLPHESHGLGEQEVTRQDRQNYVSCEKVAYQKVLDCMENCVEEMPLQSTMTYLKMLHIYINVCLSPVATLSERIEKVSIVYQFLGIWHN